ncbi:MAG: IS66 family transposase [Planctomycetes bacterium]|nr:IS66 family transposase [Planctomycetota bacterium]
MLEVSSLSRYELVEQLLTEATRSRALEGEVTRERAKREDIEAKFARERAMREDIEAKFARLDAAYRSVKEQLELINRRFYLAKAERVDTAQLEFEFAALNARLKEIVREGMGEPEPPAAPPADPPSSGSNGRGGRGKPKGRRPLFDANRVPDDRIRIENPALQGVAREVGVETSFRIGFQRPKPLLIAVDRVKYEITKPNGNASIVITPVPRECMRRGILAPSMIARILLQKFGSAIPFHRQAKMLAADGIHVDDGTMCRYAEHIGATLGTIVDAMADEARRTAFCLSTDATGVYIQPSPDDRKGARRPCKRGHFFVVLADRDHVFFEYTRHHRSEPVCDMFRGFSGFIQADANSVYDAIFRGQALTKGSNAKPPKEVACWSHARRGFWECAVTSKEADARQALFRIVRMFDEERKWTDLAPEARKQARDRILRPLVDELFAWAKEREPIHAPTRSRLARSFGYLKRHEAALRRFLEDGRLPLTNNHTERELRNLAVCRKNWLFFGSDENATAAANLFSLISSARLWALDVEQYLADIMLALPQWPLARHLELAPKYWADTRARILAASERNARVLRDGIGNLVIPAAPAAAE